MLLVGKQYDEEKVRLYHAQDGICPLCKQKLNDDITSNHLDHDHTLVGPNAGRVRALLCILCNGTEGQIKHKFVSSGLASKGVNITEWLAALVEYYSADISNNRIHRQYMPDKTKWFSRLNKPEMHAELDQLGVSYNPKLTKEKLVPIYKKALKASIVCK